jgi:hypothetical protein
VKLPAQSVRVLLYGLTGPAAEDHLAKLLNQPGYEKRQRIIVALLFELGSERSVDAVKRVLDSRGDYEHFSMAVTMLMNVGGPSGRDAVVMAKTDTWMPSLGRTTIAFCLPRRRSHSNGWRAPSRSSTVRTVCSTTQSSQSDWRRTRNLAWMTKRIRVTW